MECENSKLEISKSPLKKLNKIQKEIIENAKRNDEIKGKLLE